MSKQKKYSGHCFCGNITYVVMEEAITSGVCHCNACQRLTGGSCWPFIVVRSESLHITGELKELTRIGGSGQKVHAGFCSNCGSTLFGRPEIWPHIRTISISSLNNLEKFLPKMHVWTEDAQDWILLNQEIEQFSQNPPGRA